MFLRFGNMNKDALFLFDSEFNLWVPLKTALKRENEIAASNTRKADEAGLAPG